MRRQREWPAGLIKREVEVPARTVHANGIDIHYLEQGEGDTLVRLHGGVVSTNPLWTGVPIAYASHMEALAAHFRVIAPTPAGGDGPRTARVR